MAKVNITIDTESKVFNVEMNGQSLSNISGISIYKSYCEKEDEYEICLQTSTESDDGVRTNVNHYMECEKSKAELLEGKAVASEISGFVKKVELTPVQKQIVEWLKK